MAKPKDNRIIIDKSDFSKGIGESPYVGNGFIKHVDLGYTEGLLRSSASPTEETFTTAVVDDLVAIKFNEGDGKVYAADQDGNLYVRGGTNWTEITGGTGTANTTVGLAAWKNHIFVITTNTIDIYDVAGTTWYNDWWSGKGTAFGNTTDSPCPTITMTNDILYICAKNYVYGIEENAGQVFDPNVAGTYTVRDKVLDLPSNYMISSVCQLGSKMLLGTRVGAYFNTVKKAVIFPWNTTDPSYTDPIIIEENGINQMLTAPNGYAYFVAGIEHTIYRTDGYTAQLVKRLPFNASESGITDYLSPKEGAMILHDGKIFTGVSSTGSRPSQKVFNYPIGIYSLDINNGHRLCFEGTLANGNEDSPVKIRSLLSVSNNEYLAAYTDYDSNNNLIFGINSFLDSTPYSNNTTEFQSKLYVVGDKINSRTFEYIEVRLATPMVASGQSFSVYYREDAGKATNTTGWTQVGSTISYSSSSPSNQIHRFRFRKDLTSLQIKFVADHGSGTGVYRAYETILEHIIIN